MRAIVHEAGAPLRVAEMPVPVPGAEDVLIRVAAAALNRADLLQRAGRYPPPAGASPLLGMEVSGEIAAIGANVTRWRVGDAVCALMGGGGYAEFALAHEGSVLPVPKGVSLVDAAALPEATMTVWTNVFEDGRLAAGESFLVHGGASGIGTMAIQMAKAAGARAFATAGTAEKVQVCCDLGAARAVNYKTEDFEAVITEAGGADVVLDIVGGSYLAKNLALLKPHGRITVIATQGGVKGELNLMAVMAKRATITGSTLRARAHAEKARIAREVERVVWPWIEARLVKPVVDSRFALEDAEDAHARMQAGAHVGKILLTL